MTHQVEIALSSDDKNTIFCIVVSSLENKKITQKQLIDAITDYLEILAEPSSKEVH